jgi:gas vesicle protein
MAEKDSGNSFLIGFVLGAIAGVAVGFLYAPKSGKETRTLLKEKIGEVRGKASELMGDTGKKIKEK